MTFLYVILAILSFGLLIVLHELGHFLTARLFGVGINEFSIGMGPKLFSWKGKPRKEKTTSEASANTEIAPQDEAELPCTTYSLRALPFGGYVSMVGEDEKCDDPTAFFKQARVAKTDYCDRRCTLEYSAWLFADADHRAVLRTPCDQHHWRL